MFTFLFFILSLASVFDATLSRTDISFSTFKVYGPGLSSDFDVPNRHFLIDFYDEKGDFVDPKSWLDYESDDENDGDDSKRGEGFFGVAYHGKVDQPAQVRISLSPVRHNASLLVRFRLKSSVAEVSGIRIIVMLGRQTIVPLERAIRIPGPLYDCATCHCPFGHVDDFLTNLKCNKALPAAQFNVFSRTAGINVSASLAYAEKTFAIHPGAHSFCYYLIKSDNSIHRKCYGDHVGFNMFVDEVLLYLARKTKLPATHFLINLGDWPLIKKSRFPAHPQPRDLIPAMLSWCGSNEAYDLVLPTYDLTQSSLHGMDRVSLDIASVLAPPVPIRKEDGGYLSAHGTWQQKNDVAFWRGRDSRQERLDLVKLARSHPEANIDAALTRFFFFRDKIEEYGPETNSVSFFSFFRNRYQISLDGTVAAYRTPYLLGSGTTLLKQESPYFEHFYEDLKPFEHYIPVKRDLSDLLKQLQWARDNPDKAEAIAENARQYAWNNLLPHHVICDYVKLLVKYASLVVDPPGLPRAAYDGLPVKAEELERVDAPTSTCDCQRKVKVRRDEL